MKKLIIILSIIIVVLDYFNIGYYRYIGRTLFFTLIAIELFKRENLKDSGYAFCAMFFALAQFTGVISIFFNTSKPILDYLFYLLNMFSVFAYSSLLFEFFKSLKRKVVFKKGFVSICIVLGLGLFIGVKTFEIVLESKSTASNIMDQILIITYIFVIISTLITTIINYVINDEKESDAYLIQLIGVVSVVFSEIILISMFYGEITLVPKLLSTLLFVTGISLIYFKLIDKKIKESLYNEKVFK